MRFLEGGALARTVSLPDAAVTVTVIVPEAFALTERIVKWTVLPDPPPPPPFPDVNPEQFSAGGVTAGPMPLGV